MATSLAGHTPSAAAQRRAEDADVDLEAARTNDPETYKMLNAEEVIRADGELAGLVAQTLSVIFPQADIFRLDVGSNARFRIFPEPAEKDLDRLEDAAARLVSAASVPNAMFRVVNDLRGERREVLVPVPPDGWRGDERAARPSPSDCVASGWLVRLVLRPLVPDAPVL
jgi:hypothetical protein